MKNPTRTANPRTLLLLCGALITGMAQANAQSLTVTTLAGANGQGAYLDGPGGSARFRNPSSLAVDASGNIYVADTGNNAIRKVTPAGVTSTLAGAPGLTTGVDGTGTSASFPDPYGIAVNASGNLYVADINLNTIRQITPAGVVTTFAGTSGVAGSTNGTGTSASFSGPIAIAVDTAGNLYVAEETNNTIRKITPAGVVTTFAGQVGVVGNIDGAASSASFNHPRGIAVDGSGNVFVADNFNDTIRKITPAGQVSTLAGSPGVSGSLDGMGGYALFNGPTGVTVDGNGNIFVTDSNNNTVRRITPSGSVTTVAGTASPYWSVIGQDGTGPNVKFNFPSGVAVDAAGNLYIADTQDCSIRKGASSGAPYVGTAPLTQTVSVGETATFTVAASSATEMSYQWSLNGAPIAGATSASFTTEPIQLSDQGLYSVAVTNGTGTTVSAASLTATFSHDATYAFNSWSSSTPLPAATSYVAVAFDGSQFLAVGLDGTAFSSPDGVKWTASVTNGPPGKTWGELNSVANVPGGNLLVAVGNGGAVVTFESGTYNGTQQASSTTSLLTGVTAGNGSLVAVGYGGACVTSNLTASAWRAASTGTSQNLNAVAYGNGTFVAVGIAGTVVTSPDGSTWTVQQLGASNDLYGVAYGSRGFVAVGANGAIFISPDGVLWQPEASPTSTVLVHVGYGDGTFVAVGFLGTVLTSSDEGITWTSQDSGTLARLDGVVLGNGSFVLTGTGGVVVQSGAANPSRIINLSSRATVGTGGNILIAGFVINGSGTKQILLRGVGPTLSEFGVSQALQASSLALVSPSGATLDTNSAWGGGTTLAEAFVQVGAFSLPAKSADAALLLPLGASNYTAQLSGVAGGTGIGLAEIYDADTGTPTARLINISARASVGTGSNILIAGFVISGNTPETVLIRGVGPALTQFGVAGALAKPQLALYDSGNNTLQANTGWGGGANLSQVFTQVGAFSLPAGSADSAILVTLPPGAYTAEVSGVNSSTGVALAEIYEVQ
ncbi:MAG: hypothetical protein ABSF76_16580 [Opitutaceae bacterium]